MQPIKTSSCNSTFVAEGCYDLPAYKGDGFIITFWKPSKEELILLNGGFPIKLSVMGNAPQPVYVEVETL
jgi:hypothetical protein